MFEPSNPIEINENVKTFAAHVAAFAEALSQANEDEPSQLKYIFISCERAFNLAHKQLCDNLSSWGQENNLSQDDWFSYFTQVDIDFLMQTTLVAIKAVDEITENFDAKKTAMSMLLNNSFLICAGFYAYQSEPDTFKLTETLSEIIEIIFKHPDKHFNEQFPVLTNILKLVNVFLRAIEFESSLLVEIQKYASRFKLCAVESFPKDMEDNYLYFSVMDEEFYCQHKHLDKPVKVFYQQIATLKESRAIYLLVDDKSNIHNVYSKIGELKSDRGGMKAVSGEFALNLQLNCIQRYKEIEGANAVKVQFAKCIAKEKLTDTEKNILNKLIKFCLEKTTHNRLVKFYRIVRDYVTRNHFMISCAGTMQATIFFSPKFETTIQDMERRCQQIFTAELTYTKMANVPIDKRIVRLEKMLGITDANNSNLESNDISPFQKFIQRLVQITGKLNELENRVTENTTTIVYSTFG